MHYMILIVDRHGKYSRRERFFGATPKGGVAKYATREAAEAIADEIRGWPVDHGIRRYVTVMQA